ncbi:ATP-binding protein [Actinocorallia sp. A-T 12471]|uniref:ATP-binding protein n=1 Tax=Actinocorallia sp. A-T 12471 TaxID=3089813 RepID=UPI0029CE4545|nr:ATP-binding protein [Actinocorallia sp. A-T 12471]MDX6739203.1 ATP-binding protein [Actinocorallia sp. A-T 12471]
MTSAAATSIEASPHVSFLEGGRIEYRQEFPAERGVVRVIRKAVGMMCQAWSLPEPLIETAELVVSEIVTNAVRVSPPGELLRATVRPTLGGGLYFDCADRARDVPGTPAMPDEDAEDGRGLAIVEFLTPKHGWRALPGGWKSFWFVLEPPIEEDAVTNESTDTGPEPPVS